MSRARGAAGLLAVGAGAAVLVWGLAGPAGAHEGKEPDKRDETRSLSCEQLADKYGVEGEWLQYKIEEGDLPAEGESRSYMLSDRGTPDDESDDATLTITTVIEKKTFDWESNVGIDAVFVKGGEGGSWFYGYQPDVAADGTVTFPGEEATEGVDHGTPPYREAHKNQISHVTFCWDDEHKPPSTTTTTESTTTTTESTTTTTESTTTTVEDTTTTVEDNPGESTTTVELAGNPGESSTSTVPVEVVANPDTLPRTGSSNSTALLVALGSILVLGGGALLASTRIARRRA